MEEFGHPHRVFHFETAMSTSFRILYRAACQWSENKDLRLGAALAYYTLFSIAPLLVVAIFIAGSIFGEDAARGQVAEHLEKTVGPEVARSVQEMVDQAARPRNGSWAPFLSIAFLVGGALGAFLHIRGSLCTIWKLEPPHGSSILGVLLDYFLALVMVVCTGLLLAVSLAASMLVPVLRRLVVHGLPEVRHWLEEKIPPLGGLLKESFLESADTWQAVEWGFSLLYLTLFFAVVYRIFSGGRVSWLYVWYGSFIAAILFTLGKVGLSLYLVHAGVASMYGAASSLVIFLLWIYWSSQVLFFGAELIQARRTRHEWLKGT